MKRPLLYILFLLMGVFCHTQTPGQTETENWIKENQIEFGNPTPPKDFKKFIDCKGRPGYRKNIGDTIVLYSTGSSTAEDLTTFKRSVEKENFNIFRYPTVVQKNGTVIVAQLSENIFIWRNDTLYLYDKHNSKAEKEFIKIMDDFHSNKISKEKYRYKMENFDEGLFPNSPKFKIIYYKGIFKNSFQYTFDVQENFREETVTLTNQWTENEMDYFEISLHTHTDGRYRFNQDMTTFERTNCK